MLKNMAMHDRRNTTGNTFEWHPNTLHSRQMDSDGLRTALEKIYMLKMVPCLPPPPLEISIMGLGDHKMQRTIYTSVRL